MSAESWAQGIFERSVAYSPAMRAQLNALGIHTDDQEAVVTYRVLVTGSRDWPRPASIRTALAGLKATHGRQLFVMHGACPQGADKAAADWCTETGTDVGAYPADWASYPRAAGFIRNEAMVRTRPDLVLAFIAPCVKPWCARRQPHGSHGATDCLDRVQRAGLLIIREDA